MDITGRKQAEDALREAQAELARVMRLTTMGDLAASIAHEINQPLAAVVNNGNACLRWLASGTASVDEMREAVQSIIADARHAADVIRSVCALLRRSEPEMTS